MVKKIVSFFQQGKMSFNFVFIFTLIILCVFFCFIWITVYSLSLPVNNTSTVLATLIMVTTASYVVGNVLGFLFGLPRTHQESSEENKPEHVPEQKIAYQINTNLEQISDWLTKMLIGVGLVEMKDLMAFLVSVSSKISSDIGHPGAESIIIASILCAIVLGFFATYLGTRLYIASALASADTVLQEISEEASEVLAEE